MLALIAKWHESSWLWFVQHAQSRYALAWLALVAFTDTVFSPLTAEVFLSALILAHRERWRTFLAVSLTFSIAGATAGYWLLYWLFHSFGKPLLALYGLDEAYAISQTLLSGQIFFTMMLVSFTPLPDKLFIYAAGILGAPFFPYLVGFAFGRGARMAVVTYLMWRFGKHVLDIIQKYLLWFTVLIVALGVIYSVVRWHLFLL